MEFEAESIKVAGLVTEKLPDGSTAVFNPDSKTVYSLNASAAAAWEACQPKATLSQVAGEMQRVLNAPVSQEIAMEAISQLLEKGLVTTSAPQAFQLPVASRRSMLSAIAGVAVPVVLALTVAEQRAFALIAGSGTTTTTTHVT